MSRLAQTIKQNQYLIREKKIIPRDYHFPLELFGVPKIHTLVGARRSGKTSVMTQWIQAFEKNGLLNYSDVIFLDYATLKGHEYPSAEQFVEAFHILYPDRIPRFFLDEIQSDPHFKYSLLKLYNKGYKIFVTGSNSKLLSYELATELRGRSYEFHIQGLSFREYCRFRGYEKSSATIFTPLERGSITALFYDYLHFGTYPDLALITNKDIATSLLDGYLNTLLFRDIQERYGRDTTYGIEYLIKQLILGNTKHTNLHKVYQELKSQGKRISKDSVYNFITILQHIFFISELSDSYKPKAQSKYFINDRGYMQLYSQQKNFGQKWEHCIYNHLIREGGSLGYAHHNKQEIDFINNHGDCIQVCYQLTEENYTREIGPLLSSPSNHKILYLLEETHLEIPNEIEVRNIFHLL